MTTDVIVGFPQETEEEFETTKKFIEKVGFYETHIFKYSRREGTKAAEMDNQVPEHIKAERSSVLIALGEENRRKYIQEYKGREAEVLIEEQVIYNGKKVWTGHTKEYMKIALEDDRNLQNCIIKVQIDNDLQIIH